MLQDNKMSLICVSISAQQYNKPDQNPILEKQMSLGLPEIHDVKMGS